MVALGWEHNRVALTAQIHSWCEFRENNPLIERLTSPREYCNIPNSSCVVRGHFLGWRRQWRWQGEGNRATYGRDGFQTPAVEQACITYAAISTQNSWHIPQSMFEFLEKII